MLQVPRPSALHVPSSGSGSGGGAAGDSSTSRSTLSAVSSNMPLSPAQSLSMPTPHAGMRRKGSVALAAPLGASSSRPNTSTSGGSGGSNNSMFQTGTLVLPLAANSTNST